MADNRLDRELQTRDHTARKRAWTRPEVLPTPKPHADWEYHWVRVATRGQADPTNVSLKLREGWEPVKALDHPEITMFHTENERFKDNVIMGGLMLCRAPKEMVEDRNRSYVDADAQQVESVDHSLMRESDPRMPLFNQRDTKVTFGRGKRK